MLRDFARHFDKDPSLIYLNSGTHSLTPREVLDAADRYRREYERNPSDELIGVWKRLWAIQGELGEFFHARREDLFLRANVTAVLNDLILGAPIARGEEILMTDLEYGAIVRLCRFRAERHGLKLRQVPASRLVEEIRPETKMMVISEILTGTGEVLPVAEIGRQTRKRGVFLVVDGAHTPGAIPLDFQKFEDVDAYGANLHKWMMGPKGTSFGWVPKRNHDRIQPIHAGWTTSDLITPFDEFGGGDKFQERMLHSACHDFSPYLALHETFAFWKREGESAIRERIYALQRQIETAIDSKLGWKKVSPPAGPLRGPLLSYELPESWQSKGFGWWPYLARERKLQISITQVTGRWCLRVSPHAYNTEDECERAVSILGGVRPS